VEECCLWQHLVCSKTFAKLTRSPIRRSPQAHLLFMQIIIIIFPPSLNIFHFIPAGGNLNDNGKALADWQAACWAS